MTYEPGGSDRREELVAVIRRVRNRWRLKLALRGAVIVVAGTLLALLLSASSLEALRFSPAAIITFRVIALVVFAGLVMIGFVQPLRRRVTDGQVALYLEEKDPTLEAAILSAIESVPEADASGRGPSPKLVERLVDQAIEKCRTLEDGVAVERASLRKQLYTLGGIAVAATLLLVFGPAFLRSGMSALLIISRSAEAASPYKIEVTPGNAKLPRGSDQGVKAKLLGFAAPEATLMVRTDPAGSFDRVPLVAGDRAWSVRGHALRRREVCRLLRRIERRPTPPPSGWMWSICRPSTSWCSSITSRPIRVCSRARSIPAAISLPSRAPTSGMKITATMATPGGRVILNENGSVPLTKEAGRHVRGQLQGRGTGLLQDRARGTRGREGERVAAVHDRRAVRPDAVGGLQQAGTRHQRDARSKKSSPKCAPTMTTA